VNAPGFWELIFLGGLALLIFGPERLPKMARDAGRMIGRFKREASATLDELKRSADLDDIRGLTQEMRGVTADLKQSMTIGPLDADQPRAAVPAGSAQGGPGDTGPPVGQGFPAGGHTPFDPDAT
jgi:sec-independent protein translocase protein TatB